jgi:uncharacterized membrane protein (DUF4010 family)
MRLQWDEVNALTLFHYPDDENIIASPAHRTRPTLHIHGCHFLLVLGVHVRQMAFTAVNAIEVRRHERARSAALAGAYLTEALHLARVIDLVELEHAELHLLVLVLLLLGLGVDLLFTLLTAAQQTKGNVKLGVVGNAARRQHRGVLKLATAEKHALLFGRHALASLDGCLHVANGGIYGQVEDLSPICKAAAKRCL